MKKAATMPNKVVKLHSNCCGAPVIKQFPDNDFSRCSKCGKKYLSAETKEKSETAIEERTWWQENGGTVIWIIIVGLLILFTAAASHWRADPNATDCPGGGEYCNQ